MNINFCLIQLYVETVLLETIQFNISIQLNLKTVPFQTIQFSVITHFSSIWPIDRILLGTTTLGKRGPESDGNQRVLRIPQRSSITTASPPDCLMSYPHICWKCPWCNGYRRRKWTRRHEFKSWTRLIAFHIALIPLGKVWIQLFSLQQWVNSRTEWVLQPWWGKLSRRRNTLNSNLLNSA